MPNSVPSAKDESGGFFGALRTIPRKALNSFQGFKRFKEQRDESAAIFDRKGARIGVLTGLLAPTPASVSPFTSRHSASKPIANGRAYESTEAEHSKGSRATPDLGRSATPGVSDEAWGGSQRSSAVISDAPDLTTLSSSGSRQGTRAREHARPASWQARRLAMMHETQPGEAQLTMMHEAKQEVGESQFVDIVIHEKMKQEYWDSYNEAENPKTVLSDFEEYMRKVHDEAILDTDLLDKDMINCAVGFTMKTPREELMSAYSRECREKYSLPLGPRQRVGAQLSTPEKLLYGGWSLGSSRLDMLWETNRQGMRGCRHLNLAGNRVEDRSIPVICAEILPTIETIDLSKNLLTHLGAKHLADAIRSRRVRSPLLELNLEENMLGKVCEDDVCCLVKALEDMCPMLRGLSLAKNSLGKVDSNIGRELGSLVSSASKLKVLDLHWNHFGGPGAYQLLLGILENGQGTGILSRLDLSWNRLGFVDEAQPHAVPSKVLADVLEDHKRLFHVDISYNHLGLEACQHIAAGLRTNQTLMGFHIAGNSAALDANGFLIPHEKPRAISPPVMNPHSLSFLDPETRGQRRQDVKFVSTPRSFPSTPGQSPSHKNDCTNIFGIDGSIKSGCDHHALNLMHTTNHNGHDTSAFRAECCWICDRWRPVPLCWTPGVSGSLHAEEVDSVRAFLSVDSFRRAMPLERKPKASPQGHEVWRGHFMLPPPTSAHPILVIFQVNGVMECARDLPIRILHKDQAIRKTPARDAGTSVPGQISKEIDADLRHDFAVERANEVTCDDAEYCYMGAQGVSRQPLVVTEDHVEHGKLRVAPRAMAVGASKVQHKWTRTISVWASWVEEDEILLEKMIAHDLSLSKVSKVIGDVPEHVVSNAILPYYGALISAYRYLAVQGSGRAVFGISYNTLTTIGNKSDIFDDTMSSQVFVNHSIAACVVDKRQASMVRVRADNVIVRYQFVETLIRAAHSKHVTMEASEGIENFLQSLDAQMHEYRQDLDDFRKSYFVEEMDLVFKSYLRVLHGVYEMYCNKHKSPTSNGLMSVLSWSEFLNDCEGFDTRFARRKAPNAFLYGLMWHVDEVSSERHMHLNFVEFLVAIGAVVYMRKFWHVEEFSDLVEEFLEDHLVPLFDAKGTAEQKEAVFKGAHDGQEGRPMALSKAELRAAFENIFKIADEDRSGTLSMREFRNAFRNPKVLSVLGGSSFKAEDFTRIFEAIDDDDSACLTIDEALQGFATIRRLEMTADCSRMFLRSLCDGISSEDGAVPASALVCVLLGLATQRKLMRLSLDPADIFKFLRPKGDSAYWAESFQVESLIVDIMRLRSHTPIPKWKIVLKQVFESADKDQSGSISKQEWRGELQCPSVIYKLVKQCGIPKADLDHCFEVLDADGSHSLTEVELQEGFENFLNGDRSETKRASLRSLSQAKVNEVKEDEPVKEDKEKKAVDKTDKRMKRAKTKGVEDPDVKGDNAKGKSKAKKHAAVLRSLTSGAETPLDLPAASLGNETGTEKEGGKSGQLLLPGDEKPAPSGSRRTSTRKSNSGPVTGGPKPARRASFSPPKMP